MYDLIGDIHGHADELIALLHCLGYHRRDGVYSHPDRQVLFLGDFIDRGPKIREVLDIVREMVLNQRAIAVLGNHEWNALAYHTPDPLQPGQYLRRHGKKNELQHRATLDQLSPEVLELNLDWFRTLPLWLELEGLRAVHACWDPASITCVAPLLASEGALTTRLLEQTCRQFNSTDELNPHFRAVEILLKGKEAELPENTLFHDKDGHARRGVRTRWYLPPVGQTYRTYALQSAEVECDLELHSAVISAAAPYPASDKPVFIGHYWLQGDSPALLADNVACLDYSVAKGGFLCAYRWDGEQSLREQNFVRVG